MKKYALYPALMAAAALAFSACSDDNNGSDNNTPAGGCTASVCQDASTLLVCNTATGTTTPQACPNGCETNACKGDTPQKCTASICLGANFLSECDTATGIATQKACANGCVNNACQDKPATKCTENRCLDAKTLLECDTATGTFSPIDCPNGCDGTACKTNVDDKCTADVCKDPQTLLVCDKTSGKTSPKDCPAGCENNACKTESKTCTDSCFDSKTLYRCDPSTGQKFADKCPNDGFCADSKCISKSEIIGKPCMTEADAFCDGDSIVYCAETGSGNVWTKMNCGNGYQCSLLKGESMCTEKCTTPGAKSSSCGSGFQFETICTQTEAGLIQVRQDDSMKECEYGCADNKVCVTAGNCVESCLSSSTAVICTDGYANTFACDAGKSCFMSADKKAKCGFTCNPATAAKKRCYFEHPDDPNSESAYADVECRDGGNGSYGYEIINYTKCTNGCDDATGCK